MPNQHNFISNVESLAPKFFCYLCGASEMEECESSTNSSKIF